MGVSDSNEKGPCPLSARAVCARSRLLPLLKIGTKSGQSKEALICIMDLPSDEEILDLQDKYLTQTHCFLSFILNKDIECMKTFANKWGPIPHTFLHAAGRRKVLEGNVARATGAVAQVPRRL
jgi:hypothetical protein